MDVLYESKAIEITSLVVDVFTLLTYLVCLYLSFSTIRHDLSRSAYILLGA